MDRAHYPLVTLFILIGLISTFLIFYYPRIYNVFPLDDTYIHLVYAKNLAQGLGFSFNSGEPSIGTTSPLWVIFLAFFFYLGLDIYSAAISFSLTLFLCSGLLVGLITKDLLSDIPCEEEKMVYSLPLFSASLYLLNGNIHWYLFSGMETLLFHFFSLLSIYLYRHYGLSVKTGLSLGLLLLTRITEGTLIVAIVIVDLFRGRKGYSGYLATVVVYLPYLISTYLVTGNFIPTTALGKTITWVDGQFRPVRTASFLLACLKYLFFYNPQIFLLLVLILLVFGSQVWVFFRKRGGLKIRQGVRESYLLWVIILWGIFHVGIYAFTFRTLAHHLRYLSGVFPVIILLSAFSLAECAKKWGFLRRWLLSPFMIAVLIITFFNLHFWKEVYKGNIEHIQNVYIKAAEWIKGNTSPSDRIAGFDIGIVKYISNREIIDLGGLVNPEVYPYLAIHDCGDYLWQKKVNYILYSRFPDCDLITGIYRAEYGEKRLLKQKQLASFRTDYFNTPTILHSFELDIYRIEGWLKRDLEGVKEQFVVKEALCNFPVNHTFRGGIELIGCDLDKPEFTIVKGMAQAIYLTYYWRKITPSGSSSLVRTTFYNPDTCQIIMEKHHNPTQGIYPMYIWRPGEIVREHHLFWVPDDSPPGEYEIRINLVDDYPLGRVKPMGQRIKRLIKEVLGLDASYFPRDEEVNKDILIGKFKVIPSILKPIRFKYKKF